MTSYATAVESAKFLRKALRARFPATTFSVRLDRGTAYGCASVSWTDGPTTQLVDPVVRAFAGQGFDGMTDSSYHIDNRLPDGRQTGLRLVNTERKVSVALARKAAAQVAAYYGVQPPVVQERDGYWTVEHDTVQVAGTQDYWSTLIHRAASDHSRYALEENGR